jgi:hypothetical protein
MAHLFNASEFISSALAAQAKGDDAQANLMGYCAGALGHDQGLALDDLWLVDDSVYGSAMWCGVVDGWYAAQDERAARANALTF